MVREDWEYIQLPKPMVDKLKKITAKQDMKEQGLGKPSKLIEYLVRKYFEEIRE